VKRYLGDASFQRKTEMMKKSEKVWIDDKARSLDPDHGRKRSVL
jgi:hypothetical protein